MQERTEVESNPVEGPFAPPGMNVFAPEGETEPTRASSRLNGKSTSKLTFEDIAALKGVAFARELFALHEAATVYHPSSESIGATLTALRAEVATEADMRQAGPTVLTYLRDPKVRAKDALRVWLRNHYPEDYKRFTVDLGSPRKKMAARPTNAYGVVRRVPPELQERFLAEGKRWCPGCVQPKPLNDFVYGTGNKTSRCRDCRRHKPVIQEEVGQ